MLDLLSERDKEFVRAVAAGYSNLEIAEMLRLTHGSVKQRIKAIYDKTGMGNRVELALWWMKREHTVAESAVPVALVDDKKPEPIASIQLR
jgi:DNA-binding NarL/FixJ family response regulator